MTRITTHYRYKRPPRKRKAVALEVPAIVTRAGKRSTRPPSEPQAATSSHDGTKSAIVTTTSKKRHEDSPAPPANDDRKPAIVTIRRRGRRFADVPDLSPEELKRRGDAADALWHELVRRGTGSRDACGAPAAIDG